MSDPPLGRISLTHFSQAASAGAFYKASITPITGGRRASDWLAHEQAQARPVRLALARSLELQAYRTRTELLRVDLIHGAPLSSAR